MPTEVKKVFSGGLFIQEKGPSTEYKIMTHNLQKVKMIQAKMGNELTSLKARQDLVTLHHKVLKEINNLTENDGSLSGEKLENALKEIQEDLNLKMSWQIKEIENKFKDPDLQKELEEVEKKFQPFFNFIEETLANGNAIKNAGSSFSKEQKERLKENIKMDMEDLNTENDMHIQKISRLNNEIHECHQSARLMLKTLDETYKNHIRNIRSH